METKLFDARKRCVLLYKAFRLSDEEIAEKLNVSVSTVDKDLRIIYDKMKVDCLVMAVIIALIQEEITMKDILCVYCTSDQG